MLCRTMSRSLPLGKGKYVILSLILVAKFFTNLQGIVLHYFFLIYLTLGWKIDLKGLFIYFFGYIFHVYISKAFLGVVASAGKTRESKSLVARP